MSDNKEIYLVLSCVQWEGTEVIKAFADKDKAEAFAKICKEYPRCPQGPEVEDPDAMWDEWDKERLSWLANHPGGEESAMADWFTVNPVVLEG
jgi:hypothetical protein